MTPKRRPAQRRGKNDRQGRPQRRDGSGSGSGQGHAQGKSHGAGPRPGGPNAHSRRPYARRPPAGPITCPMCGAVVPDLRTHIRQRHDDPESHPRH